MTALVLGYITLGVFAGIYGSIIGLGGGAIIVPVLILVFHMDIRHTVAVSLCAVFANAFSGTIAYARQKRIDLRSGLWFAGVAIPGSLLGTLVVPYVPAQTFAVVFGTLFAVVGVFLFLKPSGFADKKGGGFPGEPRKITDAHGHTFKYRVSLERGLPFSFVAGGLSSLLGIGGGVLHMPAMILWLGFPHHIAVATSHFVIAISAFIGACVFLYQGQVLPLAATCISAGAIIGAQVGAKISRSLSGTLVSRLLAVALMLIGIRMLLMSWWGK